MKKLNVFFPVLLIIVAILNFPGCGSKAKSVTSGVENLLSLIPENATGIFTMNLKKIVQLDLFKEKMLELKTAEMDKEEEFFKDYNEFIEKTGIDPEKDLDSMVLAMFSSIDFKKSENKNFVAVLNLKYEKEKILNFIEEKGESPKTDDYQGQALYHFSTKKGDKITLSFFQENRLVFGENDHVKQVIDLSRNKGKNIQDNPRLKPLFKQLKTDSMASFFFDFPENLKESQPEGTPFKMDLSKAETLLGFVDHENSTWEGEIKLISKDEESNKQVVNLLNGLKGMAALAGPEVSELVSNINLSSSAENIKLTFSIGDELLKKLQAKAKEKSEGLNRPEVTE